MLSIYVYKLSSAAYSGDALVEENDFPLFKQFTDAQVLMTSCKNHLIAEGFKVQRETDYILQMLKGEVKVCFSIEMHLTLGQVVLNDVDSIAKKFISKVGL